MRKNFSEHKRLEIFNKTNGYCYYCNKKLGFKNRSKGLRGAWNVEHRNPKVKGGTEHGRNLAASCIDCNSQKSTLTSTQFRTKLEKGKQNKGSLWPIIGGLVLGGLIAYGSNKLLNNNRKNKRF